MTTNAIFTPTQFDIAPILIFILYNQGRIQDLVLGEWGDEIRQGDLRVL